MAMAASSVLRAAGAAAMRASAARAAIPAAFSHMEAVLLSAPQYGTQGGVAFVAAIFCRSYCSSSNGLNTTAADPEGNKLYKISAQDVSANGPKGEMLYQISPVAGPNGQKLYKIVPAAGSVGTFDPAEGTPHKVAISNRPLTNEEVRQLAFDHQKWSTDIREAKWSEAEIWKQLNEKVDKISESVKKPTGFNELLANFGVKALDDFIIIVTQKLMPAYKQLKGAFKAKLEDMKANPMEWEEGDSVELHELNRRTNLPPHNQVACLRNQATSLGVLAARAMAGKRPGDAPPGDTAAKRARTAARRQKTTVSARLRRSETKHDTYVWTPPFRAPAAAARRPCTLQLCVGHRCLVFQLARAGAVPAVLRRFMADARAAFVAHNVRHDCRKLGEHHGLEVARGVELRRLVAGMGNASMERMAEEHLGLVGVWKPRRVGTSRWHARRLTKGQVEYACVDACLSFHLGYVVRVGGRHVVATVTAHAGAARRWVHATRWRLGPRLRADGVATVGMGMQWTPPFRRATIRPGTLQLCAGHRCLVLQLARADADAAVPAALRRFLADERVVFRVVFVGYGVRSDCRKLKEHHGVEVARTVELLSLAGMGNTSMQRMAEEHLGWLV
uniref:3'-5' exonuclease domain-containing protein n=1 Tax=Oryza barthii TaxID=65489 RepID=A0A0D3GLJ1_9ORYZ